MFVVRLVALTALAVWVGGTIAPIVLAGTVPHDLGVRTHGLGSICGGLILVAFLIEKFVGPPPRRFHLRAAIAAIMFAIAVYADTTRVNSNLPAAVDLILGLMLLSWYARE